MTVKVLAITNIGGFVSKTFLFETARRPFVCPIGAARRTAAICPLLLVFSYCFRDDPRRNGTADGESKEGSEIPRSRHSSHVQIW
jgi:hypothetical protein